MRSPRNQSSSVPESNRLPVPLRDLLHRLPSDPNLAQEVSGDPREELGTPRSDRELKISTLRRLSPPPQETFGPAERGFPLGRIVHGFVIVVLNHAALILRSE